MLLGLLARKNVGNVDKIPQFFKKTEQNA